MNDLPAWARKSLESLPSEHTVLSATRVGWRQVLATTPGGAVLVTRRLVGGSRNVVLALPTPTPQTEAREPRPEFDGTLVAEATATEDEEDAQPIARLRLKGEADLQPQCAALTAAGAQCRNSSRDGSKYCISHKGYQPPGERQLATLLDTSPAAGGDRLLAVRGRGAEVEAGAQCAAVTAAGVQCRNVARGGSKYCAPHRGFQPPTAAAVARTRDTAPRVAGAPDTAPAVRRRRA